MAKTPAPAWTPQLAQRIRRLVFATAARYKIPPVYVTAHVRYPLADAARHEVMRTLIATFGLRRWQVAFIFGRDLRRVRKSVLGV
jgi:hypothetical protein